MSLSTALLELIVAEAELCSSVLVLQCVGVGVCVCVCVCVCACVYVWKAKVTRWEFNRMLNDVNSQMILEVGGTVPVGLSMPIIYIVPSCTNSKL